MELDIVSQTLNFHWVPFTNTCPSLCSHLYKIPFNLSTLTPDPPSELDILWHYGDPLGVDGAKVGVLEESHQIRLRRLLESRHGRTLKTQVGLEVLGDLTDQALEREFSDQEFRTLLVLSDLTESHGPGAEPVRLLHSAGGRSGLSGCLCGQLLPRSLASGGLASSLLGTSHWRTRVSDMVNEGFQRLACVRERSFVRREFMDQKFQNEEREEGDLGR